MVFELTESPRIFRTLLHPAKYGPVGLWMLFLLNFGTSKSRRLFNVVGFFCGCESNSVKVYKMNLELLELTYRLQERELYAQNFDEAMSNILLEDLQKVTTYKVDDNIREVCSSCSRSHSPLIFFQIIHHYEFMDKYAKVVPRNHVVADILEYIANSMHPNICILHYNYFNF